VWDGPDSWSDVAESYGSELATIGAPARQFVTKSAARFYFPRDPGYPDVLTMLNIQPGNPAGAVLAVSQLQHPGRKPRREERDARPVVQAADAPPPNTGVKADGAAGLLEPG